VASAGVVLVIAVLAIPSPMPSDASSASGSAASGSDASGSGDQESLPPGEPLDPATGDEVSGDDPLGALPALLERRSDCFRDLSEECLADVDEHGSSALADDRAALEALLSHAEQPVLLDAADAELVQRLGDSALIALAPGTEPASLLLLKGEAGWRVRDYLAATDG
jgi:hypothetical protein